MAESIWLVGAGTMARAYADVLGELGVHPLVICRSQGSALRFYEDKQIAAISGGVKAALAARPAPARAIVAIDVAELADTALALIEAGCRDILLEKPGGVDLQQIATIADAARAAGARVVLAYNRRFYGSVMAARRCLEEDGGAVSMTFDFTEASDAIVKIGHRPEVLNAWLLANSTHVIDTAFMLAGAPRSWTTLVDGVLDWHPRAARFAGHGITETGAVFSYLADWDAPGRWSIEISSRLRRFILKPMEQLQVQVRGSFAVTQMPADDDLDQRFKPGLLRQTRAFLTGEDADLLPDIFQHRDRLANIYNPMLETRPARAG